MKILLDTNILIPLEDSGKVLPDDFATMKRLCSKLSWEILVHPKQYEDIQADKDETRRVLMQSRLKQYSKLPSPPSVTEDWRQKYSISENSRQDQVDNSILFALFRGAISYLITEDVGVHKKAKRISCPEKVLRLTQILNILQKQASLKKMPPPAGLAKKYLYEIDTNQPFFDSLREEYDGFDEWYRRSAEKHRKAWCITENEKLLALCIYKEEENERITDSGYQANGRVLKLCTLKVGVAVRGQKYGERLLYSAFIFAMEENFNSVYLHTHGEEHELLVALCEEYGFNKVGTYQDDDVLLKEMQPPLSSDLSPLNYAIQYYPHIKGCDETSHFIVPIQPQYHEVLFPDISECSKGLFKDDHGIYPTPSRTIKKAYICHANINKIKLGDNLLFYRTRDRKSIEALGVVEKVVRSKKADEFLPLVSKRTVFSNAKIEELTKSECLVILFRLQRYFKVPIKSNELEKMSIKGAIQTIRQVPSDQFNQIYSKGISI